MGRRSYTKWAESPGLKGLHIISPAVGLPELAKACLPRVLVNRTDPARHKKTKDKHQKTRTNPH